MSAFFAKDLRTDFLKNPIGIDEPKPHFSYRCEGILHQSARQITVTDEASRLVWDSGMVPDDKTIDIAYEGTPLSSKTRYSWQVRIWDENHQAGGFSDSAFFETAFLDPRLWKAKWINPEEKIHPNDNQPASYLRKTFFLDRIGNGRLYITCHGLYVARINGNRVGDFVLAPGTSQYDRHLPYQTYDVTPCLHVGDNVMEVVLGDGWYRGGFGNNNLRNVYGSDLALLCQLEINKKTVIVSDESWEATQNGPIRFNDLAQGEHYDALRETLDGWHPVSAADFGVDILVCANSVPIVENESFTAKLLITPNGERVLDFGQNMAGYVEFSLSAKQGQTLTLVHGETLDQSGNFTIQNFQNARKPGLSKQQRVDYRCKDGLNRYKPLFAIFGFQYVLVTFEGEIRPEDFTAHAVYSQMEQTGFFECSDARVNQLVHNTLWSQKSNFVDIPTDCPTRERQGWTGDAQAFASTGMFLLDCYPVFKKWLGDVEACQKKDGKITSYAPTIPDSHFMFDGSAGWGDAAVIVPFLMGERYADTAILQRNYRMAKRWVDFSAARAKKSRPGRWFVRRPYQKFLVDTGMHWGEWLEPNQDAVATLTNMAMKGVPDVATAYFAYSARLLSKMGEKLGKTDDVKKYAELSDNAKTAFRLFTTDQGRIVSERQCQYVRPIAFDLLSEEEKKRAADDLDALVLRNHTHLNTGFLSTPDLCRVLAETGHLDTAYRLLLQDTKPSWLYSVTKKANTIWENWNGIDKEGIPRDSLNHYAYGAVVGWLFDGICGIRLTAGKIVIRPFPNPLLHYAKARFDSVFGRIESGWEYVGNRLRFDITVPPNATADILLPDGTSFRQDAGRKSYDIDR